MPRAWCFMFLRKTSRSRSKCFSFSIIILFFLTCVLTNGVLTETCLCTEPCSFGLQDEIDAKELSPFHTHHAAAHCKSCKVEDGQTLKTAVSSAPTGNVKVTDTRCIVSILTGHHPRRLIHTGFVPRTNDSGILRSLPIYLQSLSLRF